MANFSTGTGNTRNQAEVLKLKLRTVPAAMRMALWSGLAPGGNATKKLLAWEHRDLHHGTTHVISKNAPPHRCMCQSYIELYTHTHRQMYTQLYM